MGLPVFVRRISSITGLDGCLDCCWGLSGCSTEVHLTLRLGTRPSLNPHRARALLPGQMQPVGHPFFLLRLILCVRIIWGFTDTTEPHRRTLTPGLRRVTFMRPLMLPKHTPHRAS